MIRVAPDLGVMSYIGVIDHMTEHPALSMYIREKDKFMEESWEIVKGKGPLVASAIHSGGEVRNDLANGFKLDITQRKREEDPFTEIWTSVGDSRIIVHTSRFEVDLNRPRDKAVYVNPEDAWGLDIWKTPPGEEDINNSLEKYDEFYEEVKTLFRGLRDEHGKFFVYDIHTYNHMRDGTSGPPADPEANPEVNIGTGNLDRDKWGALVDRFMNDLSSFDYEGRKLDVRENVKFRGGQFSKWIGENFPGSACCIAVEFKKFFMDEWTGIPDMNQVELINKALHSTAPGVLEELKKAGAEF